MADLVANIAAFFEVIVIDLALSADNAVAVGLAAAALPAAQRARAVTWGVALALLLRILFGLGAVALLRIPGLMLAGGLLLFWIAWRMWRDLAVEGAPEAAPEPSARAAPDNFGRALLSIVAANIALSLDNVLAVAGVARQSPLVMTFGIVLSVVLMGVAATLIARIVSRHRWIGLIGVAAIVAAGGAMAWDDLHRLAPAYMPWAPPAWLGG
ncbi:MAG: YjbE family putative metal transport protein [Hyphomonadaceae bacterium]